MSWSTPVAGTKVQAADPRIAGGGITVAPPPGLALNDDWFTIVAYRDSAYGTLTDKPGWDTVFSIDGWIKLFRKRATASEAAVTFYGSGAGNTLAVPFSLRGGPAAISVHSKTEMRNSTPGVDIATDALPVAAAGCAVLEVFVVSWQEAQAGVNAWPGGAATLVLADSAFGSFELGIVVGLKIQTTATNVAAGKVDLVSTSSIRSYGALLALVAAAAATGNNNLQNSLKGGVAGGLQ